MAAPGGRLSVVGLEGRAERIRQCNWDARQGKRLFCLRAMLLKDR
jgi:hypothetical protein